MDTITLKWEAIGRASTEHELIAVWMMDSGCTPEEITEALEAYDRHRDLKTQTSGRPFCWICGPQR